MNVERRPRPRKSSRTLVITFLLGIGIGFSLCYALLGGTLTNLPAVVEEATAPAPRERALPDVAGLWPGRHLLIGFPGTELDGTTREIIRRYMPGAVILRESNLIDMAQAAQLVQEIKAAAGMGSGLPHLPLIVLAQEYGPAFHLLGMDNAPTNASLGGLNDMDVASKLGRLYGEALRNIGIGCVLGPVLDIYREGVTDIERKIELFGSDRNVVAAIGIAFAEGMREGGIVPVVKSYPGMGSAEYNAEGKVVINASELRELVDLTVPFKRAVEHGVPGILVGHAAVPLMDAQQPTLPTSMSRKMVQLLLRDEWKYKSPIIAADITGDPMTKMADAGEVVVQTLLAGCDAVVLEAPTLDNMELIARAIFRAVDDEVISPAMLEASKTRLDQWRSLLEQEPVTPEPSPVESIAQAAIDALGKAATNSAVSEVEHVVQPGESLSRIAQDYGVSVGDLEAWNNLGGRALQAGQTLVLRRPLSAAAAAAASAPDTEAAEDADTAEVAASADPEGTPAEEMAPAAEEAAPSPEMAVESYKVVQGDFLRRIADKFRTTPEVIMELNGITDPNRIVVGQTLKVPANPAS